MHGAQIGGMYGAQVSLMHGVILLPLTISLSPVFKTKAKNDDNWTFSSLASGQHIFISVVDDFPLPVQSTSDLYVRMKDGATHALVKFTKLSTPSIQTENVLLGIAFQNWQRQSETLRDALVEWTFRHRFTIHSGLMEQLNELPYVTVNGLSHRVPPKDLIDPKSALRSIYADEVGRFPSDSFATHYYLSVLRELNFVKSVFDKSVVEERLAYFSSQEGDSEQRAHKVKEFISFCNGSWKREFEAPIVKARSRAWLPLDNNSFCSPEECRDRLDTSGAHGNSKCYDLVLKTLPSNIVILSQEFRKALGWLDPVPATVVFKQFRLTLSIRDTNNRHSRLTTLIEYFSYLYSNGQLSAETVQSLKDLTSAISWIPIMSLSHGKLVKTIHALFSDDADLRSPFERVRPKYTTFLAAIGCVSRYAIHLVSKKKRI